MYDGHDQVFLHVYHQQIQPPSHRMSLPRELVEEILSHLQVHGKRGQQSLRNCSLVAKSWINPSRRRLFETVVIRTRDRQSWLDKISPSNTELLRHVRSFCFSGSAPQEGPDSLAQFTDIEDLYVYFPSFSRLHTIGLSETHVSSKVPEQIEMFSSCQQVLSSLTLATVSLPWRSFIALIDYFPNLRNLELSSLSFEDDNRNPAPLSRPLRGKLCVYLSEEEHLIALSDWFAGLEVEYEKLVVDVGFVSGTYSRHIVTACQKTLKRLSFQLCEFCSGSCCERWLTKLSSGYPYESLPLSGTLRTGILRDVPNTDTHGHHRHHHLHKHLEDRIFVIFRGYDVRHLSEPLLLGVF